MMKRAEYPKKIGSMKELHGLLPELLKRHGTDEELTLAALTNPILALEHLGYSFTPEVRSTLERRIRFDEETDKRLGYLEKSISKAIGKPFPFQSTSELEEALRKLLLKPQKGKQNRRKIGKEEAETVARIVRHPRPLQLPGSENTPDPLEAYVDIHPILPVLLEYREAEASAPRLASRDVFERVLKREQALPVELTDIRFSYNPEETPN